MSLVAVLAGGLRMLLSIRRVLLALCVIAFAMVLFGGGAMRSGGTLVMFGCLIVFVFGHWISPVVEGTRIKLQGSALVPTKLSRRDPYRLHSNKTNDSINIE
jgi:hypothetical protein